jgi:hypothetical protein
MLTVHLGRNFLVVSETKDLKFDKFQSKRFFEKYEIAAWNSRISSRGEI